MSNLVAAMGALMRGRQRVLGLVVRMLPLLIVTVCWAPALALLPMWPSGHRRAVQLLDRLRAWSADLSPATEV
ncbi:hypothetical protein [Streptomyces sp. NPDC054834]